MCFQHYKQLTLVSGVQRHARTINVICNTGYIFFVSSERIKVDSVRLPSPSSASVQKQNSVQIFPSLNNVTEGRVSVRTRVTSDNDDECSSFSKVSPAAYEKGGATRL